MALLRSSSNPNVSRPKASIWTAEGTNRSHTLSAPSFQSRSHTRRTFLPRIGRQEARSRRANSHGEVRLHGAGTQPQLHSVWIMARWWSGNMNTSECLSLSLHAPHLPSKNTRFCIQEFYMWFEQYPRKEQPIEECKKEMKHGLQLFWILNFQHFRLLDPEKYLLCSLAVSRFLPWAAGTEAVWFVLQTMVKFLWTMSKGPWVALEMRVCERGTLRGWIVKVTRWSNVISVDFWWREELYKREKLIWYTRYTNSEAK